MLSDFLQRALFVHLRVLICYKFCLQQFPVLSISQKLYSNIFQPQFSQTDNWKLYSIKTEFMLTMIYSGQNGLPSLCGARPTPSYNIHSASVIQFHCSLMHQHMFKHVRAFKKLYYSGAPHRVPLCCSHTCCST